MLKAADALACAGYRVHLVSVNHTSWMTATDAIVKASRQWSWSVVDYDATTGAALRRKTGVRMKLMRAAAALVGPSRVPMGVAVRAYSRAHDEIVRAASAQPANLIYGGSTGALAAVKESARRLGVPYAIDFEDFHSGEHCGPGGELTNALAARVERYVIEGASFLTAGSPMIADEYAERYGVRPLALHNTFSIAPGAASEPGSGPLRLYWFSQTLGPQRGLEDVVRAVGEAGVATELHLRANAIPDYLESLRRLQADVAPQLRIVLHDPAAPDDMVALTQPYDAGLACEEPYPLSRRICLANKIFTYLAAGIPMFLSRTPAQARIERELGEGAIGYECGDVHGLALAIRTFAADAALRVRARAAARAAAARRWHWEHPDDRGALLAAVRQAL